MKTASQKRPRVAEQDARRSDPKALKEKTQARKGRRIVMTHFPHSKAGRPRIVDDMVGTPI